MKNNTINLFAILVIASLTACMSNEEKKKKANEEGNALVAIKSELVKGAGEALKKEGKEAAEAASEGVGEVIKGITTGFDKSISQADIETSESFNQVFEIGRTEKFFDDDHGKKKKLTVYLVAHEAYKGKLKLKAFDAENKEIGRSTVEAEMEIDEAKFFDFEFDNRTPLLQAVKFTLDKK